MTSNNHGIKAALNGKQDELKNKLDDLFQGLYKAKGVRQAIAAIESGDGSFRWSRAESKEGNGVEIKLESPFWIASITKLFIAAAILKLQEKQKLMIEHPAREYLPQGYLERLHVNKKGVNKSGEITIRNLLSHTSGLPDYIEIKPKGGKSLFEKVLEEGDYSWSIMDSMQIVKEAGSPLFDPQPVENKDKKARYSDTNFQLLIAIIEEITGKPIDTVFRDMFYKPLNMQNTFHPGSKPLDPNTPEPLPVWGGNKKMDIPLAMKSFGDLYSTLTDLLNFMRNLNSGVVFDNPKTINLMQEEWNRFGFMISPIAPGWPIEYGLGMMRFEMPRFATPLKAVPAVIGHTGASGTWLFYCPEIDLYLVGAVSQVEAAAVPFRFVPKALSLLSVN